MKHVSSAPAFTTPRWAKRAGLLVVLAGIGLKAFGQTLAFAPAVNYDTGSMSGPSNIIAVDISGDGKPDLLTANNGNSTVGVLLGIGMGRFGGLRTYNAGRFPYSLVVADVSGDGKLDLLTANSVGGTISVLLGTGTGGFGNLATYDTGDMAGNNAPRGLVAADVNGDGHPDVVATNPGSGTVGVLLSTGQGGFGPVATYSTGGRSGPLSVAVADVNGDGRPDVVTANSLTNTVGVLLGDGQGNFGAVQAYNTGPGSAPFGVVVADVNGDGRPDVLTANSASGTVGVLLGTGTGSFGAVATYSAGTYSQPLSLAVADVNGDGRLDVLTANNGNNAGVVVLLGTGTGSFGAGTRVNSPGTYNYPRSLAVADVNGDGRPDVLAANAGNNTAGVLLNTTVLATRAALPGVGTSLAPNPAHGAATLTATGLPVAVRTLMGTLYSALGQPVRHLALPAAAGAAQAEVPTAGLPAGVYLLQLNALDAQGRALGGLPPQRLLVE